MAVCKSIALILIGIVLFSSSGRSDDLTNTNRSDESEASHYEQEIQPLLVRHCFDCHGAEEQKGNLRLDTLDSTFAGPSAETWHDVLNRVSIGEMPPEDATPIDTNSRRKLVNWIRINLDRVARERKETGANTVLRRLTNYEYNNTLRDLLGIDLDFARDLPPEPTSPEGFKNNGSSLGISPLQVEYYLKAARLALDKAIVEGPAPKVYSYQFEESSKGNARRNGPVTGNRMPPQGRFLGTMQEFPREGEFVVRVKAGASVPEGMGVPRMRLTIGLRADTLSPAKFLGEVDVPNSEDDKEIYEFRGRIEEFPLPGHNPKFPGVSITVTNVYEDGLEAPKVEKFKPISLNAAQKKQVKAAIDQNLPTLPISEKQVVDKKSVSSFVKSATNLQRKVEELRLLSPKHENQTDLAYRLYDVNVAIERESELIEDLARKVFGEEPSAFLASYKSINKEQLDRSSGSVGQISRYCAYRPKVKTAHWY